MRARGDPVLVDPSAEGEGYRVSQVHEHERGKRDPTKVLQLNEEEHASGPLIL